MILEIKTVTRKLTMTFLAQMSEATMRDMRYALDNGTILGYVNPTSVNRQRVFLIIDELKDYKVVVNRDWKSNQANITKLHCQSKANKNNRISSVTLEKSFSNEAAKLDFLNMFQTIKQVALKTHIYL